jgi:hypothetical protein
MKENDRKSRMELADKIAALFRLGPFIQFRCTPSTFTMESVKEVEVEAVVFLDASIPRPTWEPIVTAEEPRRLRVRLVEAAGSQPNKRVFRGVIKPTDIAPGRYRLELRSRPEDAPLARTDLLALDKSEGQAAQDHFRAYLYR